MQEETDGRSQPGEEEQREREEKNATDTDPLSSTVDHS